MKNTASALREVKRVGRTLSQRRRAASTPAQSAPDRAMLIGALARATGHSVHTIRWYESQRLIPGVRRDLQGRRTYIAWHIAWLDLVDRLRRTGMSIRQIREYAAMVKRGEAALADRLELMQAHRGRIEAMLLDLQQSLELINIKVDYYSNWLANGEQPATRPEFRRKQLPAKERG